MRLPDTHTPSFSTGRTRVNRNRAFWSQKNISPSLLFLALDWGEIIILQLVREKTFSANPPPGEQMRDVWQRKQCKAVALR